MSSKRKGNNAPQPSPNMETVYEGQSLCIHTIEKPNTEGVRLCKTVYACMHARYTQKATTQLSPRSYPTNVTQ